MDYVHENTQKSLIYHKPFPGNSFVDKIVLNCGLQSRGVLPYKSLMGTCGQPGYVFRDFCLKQGIEFIIFFCLNQGIDLSIFVLNRINVLNRVSKIGMLS